MECYSTITHARRELISSGTFVSVPVGSPPLFSPIKNPRKRKKKNTTFLNAQRRKREEMAEEMKLDLEELTQLESIAKRPRVLSLLSSEIRNLNAKLSKEAAPTAPPKAAAEKASPAVVSGVPSYVTLDKFSWDQDNDKIKIYVFLDGVEQEKVEATFNPMSVEIKFHDVQGKNYRCAIPKLNKEILPEKCKVLVKPTKVIITLAKASKGNWLDLHFKEDKLKPSTDKDKDPMAGIMDLMKNMYEEGDEDMKRTIAKAWSDARSGKTADPLKGYGP
ncbi:calcyclin-binding protein-like [Iris pallida]|uniref:Calcyclin-binding protein n=1 Tax=Iris pallida TaxID=29817 RepID=A0AAX6F6Z7_IRIPA|nr:calcyclin-binding protein-like [Iris pallida]